MGPKCNTYIIALILIIVILIGDVIEGMLEGRNRNDGKTRKKT
jgi:ABC-type dipeptide/oligopeptide/nickel transport system permease component